MSEESGREHDDHKKVQRAEQSAPALNGAVPGAPALGDMVASFGSLLGDPRLDGRGNRPVKVAVMRQMQRAYGNRAVQRLVSVQRHPPGPPHHAHPHGPDNPEVATDEGSDQGDVYEPEFQPLLTTSPDLGTALGHATHVAHIVATSFPDRRHNNTQLYPNVDRIIIISGSGVYAWRLGNADVSHPMMHAPLRGHNQTYPGFFLYNYDANSAQRFGRRGERAALEASGFHTSPISASTVSAGDLSRIFSGSAGPQRRAILAFVPLTAEERAADERRLARERERRSHQTPAEQRDQDRREDEQRYQERGRHDPLPTWNDSWNRLPAWPAEITGDDQQPPGANASYHMAVRFPLEGGDLLSGNTLAHAALQARARRARYSWEVWRINVPGSGGEAERSAGIARESDRVRSQPELPDNASGNSRVSSSGEGLSREAQQSASDWYHRDTQSISSPLLQAIMLPVSALARAGSLVMSAAVDATTFDSTHRINFNMGEGDFVVRCLAQLEAGEGEQSRARSVAVKPVRVRPIATIARDALSDPERQQQAAVTELERERARTADRDPERIRELEQTAESARIAVEGSSLQVIERAIHVKEQEREHLFLRLVSDTGGRHELIDHNPRLMALDDELQDLRRQAGVARSRERDLGTTLRPRATLVSRLTGRSYPLLLQISSPTETRAPYSVNLSDVTGTTGHIWHGTGDTAFAAAWSAFDQMAHDRNDGFGEGTLAVQLPNSGAFASGSPADRLHNFESDVQGTPAIMQRLEQLGTELAILGLVMTGAGATIVGVAATVVGAAVAAERLYRRMQEGVLYFDEAAVSDTLAVLGGLAAGAQHAQTVGRLRFTPNVPGVMRGQTVMGYTLAPAESASRLTHVGAAAGEVVNTVSQIWGDLTSLNSILAAGHGDDPESQQARLRAFTSAIQNHAVVFRHPEGENPELGNPVAPSVPAEEQQNQNNRNNQNNQNNQQGANATNGTNAQNGGQAREGSQQTRQPTPEEAAQAAAAELERQRRQSAQNATNQQAPAGGGGAANEPTGTRRLTQPLDRTQPLSNTGDRGSMADRRGMGAFSGHIDGVGHPVVIKVFPASMQARMRAELAAAQAAARTGFGPHVHGEVEIPATGGYPPSVGFAMDFVPGGFTTEVHAAHQTDADRAQAHQQANQNAMHINDNTLADVRRYGEALIAQGFVGGGDLQGFVDANGNWRPIDFGSAEPLPTDPAARARQIDRFRGVIEETQRDLRRNLERARRETGGGSSGNTGGSSEGGTGGAATDANNAGAMGSPGAASPAAAGAGGENHQGEPGRENPSGGAQGENANVPTGHAGPAPTRTTPPQQAEQYFNRTSRADLQRYWFSIGNWAEGLRWIARAVRNRNTPEARQALDNLQAARAELFDEAMSYMRRQLADQQFSMPGSVGADSDMDPTFTGPHTLEAVRLLREGMERALAARGLPTRGWMDALGINPYSDPQLSTYAIRGNDAASAAARARLHTQEFSELEAQHRATLLTQDPTGASWNAYMHNQVEAAERISPTDGANMRATYEQIEQQARQRDAEMVRAAAAIDPEIGRMSPEDAVRRLRTPEGQAMQRQARAALLAEHQARLARLQAEAGSNPNVEQREAILAETMRVKDYEDEAYHPSAIESVVEGQQAGHQVPVESGQAPRPLNDMSAEQRGNALLDSTNMVEQHMPQVEHALHAGVPANDALSPIAKYLARMLIEATELGIPIGDRNQLLSDLARRLRARVGPEVGAGGTPENRRGATMSDAEAEHIVAATDVWGLTRYGEVQANEFLAEVADLSARLRTSVALRRAMGSEVGGALQPDPAHPWRASGASAPTSTPGNRRGVPPVPLAAPGGQAAAVQRHVQRFLQRREAANNSEPGPAASGSAASGERAHRHKGD